MHILKNVNKIFQKFIQKINSYGHNIWRIYSFKRTKDSSCKTLIKIFIVRESNVRLKNAFAIKLVSREFGKQQQQQLHL